MIIFEYFFLVTSLFFPFNLYSIQLLIIDKYFQLEHHQYISSESKQKKSKQKTKKKINLIHRLPYTQQPYYYTIYPIIMIKMSD
jgi:hypothetical protein